VVVVGPLATADCTGLVTLKGHSRSLAQAKALIADSGTGVRDLVGVILRERCAVVSTLEQA
jgi:hypothetical protein